MQIRYLGMLLLLAAVWGTSFLFIKIGVAEMSPDTLVALRLIIGALILVVALYVRGLRLPTNLRVWGDLFFLGIVGLVLPYVLITWGEQHIASNMAAILNATTPLFTVILTYVWTHEEQLSGLKLVGVALGFVGVLVAVGIGAASVGSSSTQGQIAVLFAAFFYAISGIYGRRAFRGVPALIPATGQVVCGAIVITPIALVLHGIPDPLPSFKAISAVVALAVFGTSFAYIMLYWLMDRIGASRTSMVTYLLPPFALIYGAAFLDERIAPNALLGLALVVIGILFANGVLQRSTVGRQTKPSTSD